MRRLAVIALAAMAALMPVPADVVERYYSTGAYPALQRSVTGMSNATAVAWFDLLLLGASAVCLILIVRRGRILNLLAFAALVWLLFLAMWGLNYRRVPLRERLAYDDQRVTAENVTRAALAAVDRMNRLYAPAHAAPARTLDELAARLAPAMETAARRLAVKPPVPARPKQTWLASYFRRAGIDGMTDPFFLETLLAPNLLDIEQPAALAHEWGHLAGLADESEASFFGWLTCLSGDDRVQYSGWVGLYPHLVGALPPEARQSIMKRLNRGPAEDFRRIALRLEQTNEAVRSAANTTYDKFLKANRVAEGIESYDAVTRLVAGTRFRPQFVPEMR